MADGEGDEGTGERVAMPVRPSREAVVWQARCLLRAARAGTLATAEAGQPYAALVTPAPAPDLSLLMLLSGLSAHTRHLQEDGRCALMVSGEPTDLNPQTAPRLTVLGTATPEGDPALKARWIARHPYAAFYADLPDFRLVRLRASGGQFIGGFASAHRLSAADLTPDPAAVASIAAAEASIIEHMNADRVALEPHRRGARLAHGRGGCGRLRLHPRGGGPARGLVRPGVGPGRRARRTGPDERKG